MKQNGAILFDDIQYNVSVGTTKSVPLLKKEVLLSQIVLRLFEIPKIITLFDPQILRFSDDLIAAQMALIGHFQETVFEGVFLPSIKNKIQNENPLITFV